MSLVAHPLICQYAEVGILYFEYYVIFVMFFSTPQNQFKTEKSIVFFGQSWSLNTTLYLKFWKCIEIHFIST